MRKKGVAKELAEQVLEELEAADELQAARELLSSRRKVWSDLPVEKRRRRAIDLLRRRGFSGQIVYQLWQEIGRP